MNYTIDQIKQYSKLLSLTTTPEALTSFNEQNQTLGQQLTVFHIEVTLLETIQSLIDLQQQVTYLNIRDTLLGGVLKGGDRIDLEKKLDIYLPGLVEKKLTNEKLIPTELGSSLIQYKVVALYEAKLFSTELN